MAENGLHNLPNATRHMEADVHNSIQLSSKMLYMALSSHLALAARLTGRSWEQQAFQLAVVRAARAPPGHLHRAAGHVSGHRGLSARTPHVCPEAAANVRGKGNGRIPAASCVQIWLCRGSYLNTGLRICARSRTSATLPSAHFCLLPSAHFCF